VNLNDTNRNIGTVSGAVNVLGSRRDGQRRVLQRRRDGDGDDDTGDPFGLISSAAASTRPTCSRTLRVRAGMSMTRMAPTLVPRAASLEPSGDCGRHAAAPAAAARRVGVRRDAHLAPNLLGHGPGVVGLFVAARQAGDGTMARRRVQVPAACSRAADSGRPRIECRGIQSRRCDERRSRMRSCVGGEQLGVKR
jgi:hypothetical protein